MDKACPFCGSKELEDCYVYVRCNTCLAEGPASNGKRFDDHADFRDREIANEKWDVRTSDKVIERLMKDKQELVKLFCRQGVQYCHTCEDKDCGDNINIHLMEGPWMGDKLEIKYNEWVAVCKECLNVLLGSFQRLAIEALYLDPISQSDVFDNCGNKADYYVYLKG